MGWILFEKQTTPSDLQTAKVDSLALLPLQMSRPRLSMVTELDQGRPRFELRQSDSRVCEFQEQTTVLQNLMSLGRPLSFWSPVCRVGYLSGLCDQKAWGW